MLRSTLGAPCYRSPKSDDDSSVDSFVGVAHMVAEGIIVVGGPLFWGILGIGLLTSLFG